MFAGGCTLEAAAILTDDQSDPLRTIISLVDQGLIEVQSDDRPKSQSRFRMLDTIREFAVEQLIANGEEDDARRRHAEHFLHLSEVWYAGAWGPDGQECLDLQEKEHDNLRAALRWALDSGRAETALRLANTLRSLWYFHGHFREARRWFADVLALPYAPALTPLRASILNAAGQVANRLGEYATARALNEEALATAQEVGDRRVAVWTLLSLGIGATLTGNYSAARTFLDEALAANRAIGHRRWEAMCLQSLAWLCCEQEDYSAAQDFGKAALALGRECGSAYVTALALRALGIASQGQGDVSATHTALEEALDLAQQLEVRFLIGYLLEAQGSVAAALNNFTEAKARFTESLQTHRQIGERLGMIRCLEGLARLVADGHPSEALQLAAASQAVRDSMDAPHSPRERTILTGWLATARLTLGPELAKLAWVEGRSLSMDRATALALGASARSEIALSTNPTAGRLTAREQEVLRLLADGLTNGEVAAALVLSVRTVERHIAHLYAKIGARGRADAIKHALRHSIV